MSGKLVGKFFNRVKQLEFANRGEKVDSTVRKSVEKFIGMVYQSHRRDYVLPI